MKMNNKGLSLVEIIIVVAIISVLSGMVTVGLSSVISKPAEECGKKIVSVLRNTKVTTMGKQGITIDLSQTVAGDKVMITENIKKADGTTKVDTYRVGEKGITVTFKTKDGTYDLSSVDKLRLSFNRSTGGFYKAEFSDGSSDHEEYVSEINISKGTKNCKVSLYYLTGKVEIQ